MGGLVPWRQDIRLPHPCHLSWGTRGVHMGCPQAASASHLGPNLGVGAPPPAASALPVGMVAVAWLWLWPSVALHRPANLPDCPSRTLESRAGRRASLARGSVADQPPGFSMLACGDPGTRGWGQARDTGGPTGSVASGGHTGPASTAGSPGRAREHPGSRESPSVPSARATRASQGTVALATAESQFY